MSDELDPADGRQHVVETGRRACPTSIERRGPMSPGNPRRAEADAPQSCSDASNRRLRTQIDAVRHAVQRFPITAALLLEYGALALWPAIFDGDRYRALIFAMVGVALVSTFVVELAFVGLRPSRGTAREVNIRRAGFITLFGSAVSLIGTFLGVGDYGFGAASGLQAASHFSVLVTPLQLWVPIGLALCLYAYQRQHAARRSILGVIGAAALMQLVIVLRQATTVSLFELLFLAGSLALVSGFLRFRWVVVLLIAVMIVWPVLYAVRNASRDATLGSTTAFAGTTASSRLEDDREIAAAIAVHQNGIRLQGLPSPLLVLETGLLPRALQPGRPVMDTSSLLSQAVGGPATSSYTFTGIGGIWFLYGWGGLVAAFAGFGLVGVLCTRHRGPFAFVLLGGMLYELLWIETTFPDAFAGFLQFAVSALVAFIVVRPLRRSPTKFSAATAP